MVVLRQLGSAKEALLSEDHDLRQVAKCVNDFADELSSLPVTVVLRNKSARLQKIVEAADEVAPVDRAVLIYDRIGELIEDLAGELTTALFFSLPPQDKQIYLHADDWFGRATLAAFAKAADDCRDSARCLALNQWNAAVYHAMIVFQHGLEWLARRTKVRFSTENWGRIIEQIESKIRATGQSPKTKRRNDALAFYATLASHFYYVKEAWRNHVAHGRKRYGEGDARKIVTHVRDFMASIAERGATRR